jgi:hypothetical protein
MEVHFTPEVERKLNELAAQSGRGAQELVQDAVAWYVHELTAMREMLDARFRDLKSGSVEPIDGDSFFEELREREDELLKPRTS